MRTCVKLAIFFGIVLYLSLTFVYFIGFDLNHAKAWTYSTLSMSPFVYYAAWSYYMPNNSRTRNWYIGIGYFLLCVSLIVLCCYDNHEAPRFTAEGFQLVKFDHRAPSFSVSYGWFSFLAVCFALFLAFVHLMLSALMDPNQPETTTFTDELRKVERDCRPRNISTSIKSAYLLDKALNRHKKHDHSLGSYWSNHDDDGNYDPGAWRRKYDHHNLPWM